MSPDIDSPQPFHSTLPGPPALPLHPPQEGSVNGLEAWRQWRIWLRIANSGSEDTVRVYAGNVLRFLAETACKDPADYTEQDCAEFLGRFAPRGAARHQYAKALRSFFGYCLRHLMVAVDPMQFIRVKKPRRVAPIILSEDELVRLLVAAVYRLGDRAAWGILLVYLLGLRRIEAAGLRWEHVRDGEDGPVVEIHATKGADQRDPLPLSPLALECLAHLRELEPPAQARREPGYILRAAAATVNDWVHKAGVAAGLDTRKIKAHRLRASLATHLLKAGVDVTIVQAILGHLRLESTAWYLGEATDREVRHALSLAGRSRLQIAV
jgi:site-specific recombinase XerD